MTKPYLRGKIWWIKYSYGGKVRYESSHSEHYEEAELLLIGRLKEVGDLTVHVASLKRGGLTSHVGCAAELLVCADLLSKGCEVFRSVSPHSSCDMVANRDGNLRRVEVKTGKVNRRYKPTIYLGRQKGMSDILAIVDRSKGIFYFPALERALPVISDKVVTIDDISQKETIDAMGATDRKETA